MSCHTKDMDTYSKKYFHLPLYPSLLGAGMAVMAIAPITWLIGTWFEPAHDSQGAWVFLLCLVLFVWSVRSERQTITRNEQKKAVILLLVIVRGNP
jgi:hypothetical protein